MERDEILAWLLETRPERLDDLFAAADRARHEHVGDAVHLRGLVEFSSICDRHCLYCGMRRPNRDLARYRMTPDEILACAHVAAARGYGTLVLQAGEDRALPGAWIAELVARIKRETSLAVTLSLGERPPADYALWHDAGADRYLLRFETGDPELLRRLHPPLPGEDDTGGDLHRRLALVSALQDLGFETGSGIMVGLPGQTYASVAADLVLFRELDLEMIGIGCFVPHPATPAGELHDTLVRAGAHAAPPSPDVQIPATAEQTLKVLALTRLLRPDANLPASTALATVSEDGYAAGLRRGANVIMPNLTPDRYRLQYDIYPTRLRQGPTDEGAAVLACIAACGRTVGAGPGAAPRRPHADPR